jgi:predicted NUDIX family phosphoesterase
VTSEELVFVVPRRTIIEGAGWHGVRTTDVEAFLATVGQFGRFEPRSAMEADPAFKQIIPYLVLRDGLRYFLMRRSRAGGDARLHDRWSIGVGGHVNPGDGDLLGGLAREWGEELVAGSVPEFELVGLLNDDTTDVGRVHLGAVYLADAAGRDVAIRETDKLTGAFATRDEVAAVADDLETWSRLAFEHLEDRERPSASVGGGSVTRGRSDAPMP